MKRILRFFGGIMMLVISFGILYITGFIYDNANKLEIRTYFFQTNNRADMRMGVPISSDSISKTRLREMLIRKYVNEYFYVIPHDDDIATRGYLLKEMSSADVYNDWKNGEFGVIKNLAAGGAMRTVKIGRNGIIKQPDGNYWIVQYELKTWTRSNDMAAVPIVSHGQIYIKLYLEGTDQELEMRTSRDRTSFDAGQYLRRGYNPAAVFNFEVEDIKR